MNDDNNNNKDEEVSTYAKAIVFMVIAICIIAPIFVLFYNILDL